MLIDYFMRLKMLLAVYCGTAYDKVIFDCDNQTNGLSIEVLKLYMGTPPDNQQTS